MSLTITEKSQVNHAIELAGRIFVSYAAMPGRVTSPDEDAREALILAEIFVSESNKYRLENGYFD